MWQPQYVAAKDAKEEIWLSAHLALAYFPFRSFPFWDHSFEYTVRVLKSLVSAPLNRARVKGQVEDLHLHSEPFPSIREHNF